MHSQLRQATRLIWFWLPDEEDWWRHRVTGMYLHVWKRAFHIPRVPAVIALFPVTTGFKCKSRVVNEISDLSAYWLGDGTVFAVLSAGIGLHWQTNRSWKRWALTVPMS